MMDLAVERAPLLRIRNRQTRFACGQRSAWFPFHFMLDYLSRDHVSVRAELGGLVGLT